MITYFQFPYYQNLLWFEFCCDRWIGRLRYDYCGVKTFLESRGYHGTVTYDVVTDEEGANVPVATDPTLIGQPCRRQCATCNFSNGNNKTSQHQHRIVSNTVTGKFSAVIGCVSACISPHSVKGVSPAAHLGDGHIDLILVKVVAVITWRNLDLRWYGLTFFSAHKSSQLLSLPVPVSLPFAIPVSVRPPLRANHSVQTIHFPTDKRQKRKCKSFGIIAEISFNRCFINFLCARFGTVMGNYCPKHTSEPKFTQTLCKFLPLAFRTHHSLTFYLCLYFVSFKAKIINGNTSRMWLKYIVLFFQILLSFCNKSSDSRTFRTVETCQFIIE